MSNTTSTYGDETAAIMSHLHGQWRFIQLVPIADPNTGYSPDGVNSYVRPRITHQPAFNVTVSATQKTVRHPGLLVLTVRVLQNTGDADGLDYADELAGLFRNLTLTPRIYFRATTVRSLGPDGNGWDVHEVACPFYRDSIH